jgi:DNA-binding transcriptional LysR family regulator
MQIYDLKYFLAVAQVENVNKAGAALHISPGSVSKAIARLEEELGVNLFLKQGRNIKLTESGRLLQKRASAIVQLEEDTKVDLMGSKNALKITISATEILLKGFGMPVLAQLRKIVPGATFEFFVRSDAEVVDQVLSGEAHLGITTHDVVEGLDRKVVGTTQFRTCVGPGHPLYRITKKPNSVKVQELLQHGFVVPRQDILGKVSSSVAFDGWRDDKFQRKIIYKVASLSIVEDLVVQGLAVAYLPEFLITKMGAQILEVDGCPYHCNQKVSVVGRNVKDFGWLKNFFSTISAIQT